MAGTHTLLILILAWLAPVGSALADVKMTFEALPTAVRETAKREVGAGTIVDIERETEHGATIYEVEFVEQGKKYELDIAEDGTLLRRHRD